MKKIHLLCNAHIDPVWLWTREEGMAEAVSTFRVAANFCEKYEGFVFNHNESVLYEWVEEYEPELFERIKRLVKEGKWHIMGGWYLQPDCNMPSGEGFLRQIETGNAYFEDKFGIKPKTAVNFDSFGHTRGLVQILKKCGYDSYLCLRPYNFIKENNFIWKGFDGSEIIGHNIKNSVFGGYGTLKGDSVKRLEEIVKTDERDVILMPWGVGNHGGGPSEKDLNEIEEFIRLHPEVNITHSFCEDFFSELDKTKLKTVDYSLCHCMIGCYTTMVRIKQAYRRLENDLNVCEKMLMSSGAEYDAEELKKAEKALLFCQFHDILPGTVIKQGEEDALRQLSYGAEITSKLKAKAFFKMCEGQRQGKRGEIPVLVFNPNPYPITENIEVEFQLENQNWNDNEYTIAKVYDENGNFLPAQNEKEASNLSLDWRKKICFSAELKPMAINRFDCVLEIVNLPKRPVIPCEKTDEHFIFTNSEMCVHINKKTGLIDKYEVNGTDYLKAGSGKILVYKDCEDPWEMRKDGFYDILGEFTAVSDEEANEFTGYPNESFSNVRLTENGEVRAKVQVIMKNGKSFAAVTYTIPKKGTFLEIAIKTYTADVNVMYKLAFDTCFKKPEFIGQTAFGRQALEQNGEECVFQKWCAMTEGEKGFAVLNCGTYGGSAENEKMRISLLRTPAYSAHPISEDRPLCDSTINNDRIDIGEREFKFKLTVEKDRLDKNAEIYNQPCYALSFFPSGNGVKRNSELLIDNDDVILTAYKKINSKNVVHLFNSKGEESTVNVKLQNETTKIKLLPYEVKAFEIENGKLYSCELCGK